MAGRAEGDGPFERTAGPEAWTAPGNSRVGSASGSEPEEQIDMHLDLL